MIRQAKQAEGANAVEGIFAPVFETRMITLSRRERDAYNCVLAMFKANVVLNGMAMEEHRRRAAALGKPFDATKDSAWKESWLNLDNWSVKSASERDASRGHKTGIEPVFSKLSVRDPVHV